MALGEEVTYIIIGAVLGFLFIIIIIVVLIACRGRGANRFQCLAPQCLCPLWRRTERTNFITRQKNPARISTQKNIRLRLGVEQPNYDRNILVNNTNTANAINSAGSQRIVVVTGPEETRVRPEVRPMTSVRAPNAPSGPYVATVPLDNNNSYFSTSNTGGVQYAGGFVQQGSLMSSTQQTTRPYNVDSHITQVQCQDIHGQVGPAYCPPNTGIYGVGPEPPRLYPTLGSMMRREGMNEIHIHAAVPGNPGQTPAPPNVGLYPGLNIVNGVPVPPAYTTLPRE